MIYSVVFVGKRGTERKRNFTNREALDRFLNELKRDAEIYRISPIGKDKVGSVYWDGIEKYWKWSYIP